MLAYRNGFEKNVLSDDWREEKRSVSMMDQ